MGANPNVRVQNPSSGWRYAPRIRADLAPEMLNGNLENWKIRKIALLAVFETPNPRYLTIISIFSGLFLGFGEIE